MRRWPLILAIILLLTGITGLFIINTYFFRPFGPGRIRRSPGIQRGHRQRPSGRFSSTGERIYYTGNGIDFTEGPVWFSMHGGGCVRCHGTDGRGGRVTTMMGSFTAHDIRYGTLTEQNYNDALIKRAIRRGIDSEGKKIDSNMPRWQMSDKQLNDTIEYLKIL